MTNIILLTTCDNPNHIGWQRFRASLEKFGWNHELVIHPFAFGHQMEVVYEWCKRNVNTHKRFVYADAYDCLAFNTPEYFAQAWGNTKLIISAEKGCFPDDTGALRARYDNLYANNLGLYAHDWRYINCGGFACETAYFLEIANKYPITPQTHDALWMHNNWLGQEFDAELDTRCRMFMPIAHCNHTDADYTGGVARNLKTNYNPVIVHGNGRTDMTEAYKSLNLL